ncbi:MAG: cytochrome c [Bacteroidota bacterium]
MRNLQLLIHLLVITILGVFTFLITSFNIESELITETKPYIAWCGTGAYNSSTEEATRGKKLFKNYCATCHSKNMVSWATGPPLAKTISKWQKDTFSYQLFLKNSLTYIGNPNGTRRDSLVSLYDIKVNQHFFELELQEVKDLIAYFEM